MSNLPDRIAKWSFLNIVKLKCFELKLDFYQVLAVIDTESSGNTLAERFEKNYIWLYKNSELAPKFGVQIDKLKKQQMTSYGLMQTMGGVALEYSLGETYNYKVLPEMLVEPVLGVHYGCLHWLSKFKKYGPDPINTYAAYNAGIAKKINGVYINAPHVKRFQDCYNNILGK